LGVHGLWLSTASGALPLRGVLGALGVVGGGDFGAVSMTNESLALTTPRICTHERDAQVCCVSVYAGERGLVDGVVAVKAAERIVLVVGMATACTVNLHARA
jgi:hypothetical protein